MRSSRSTKRQASLTRPGASRPWSCQRPHESGKTNDGGGRKREPKNRILIHDAGATRN